MFSSSLLKREFFFVLISVFIIYLFFVCNNVNSEGKDANKCLRERQCLAIHRLREDLLYVFQVLFTHMFFYAPTLKVRTQINVQVKGVV